MKNQDYRPKVGLLQNSNVPVVDAYLRENPIPYSTSMELVTRDSNSKIVLPEIDFFSDKYILGAFVRKQNAGGTRYSKNGRLLIPEADLDQAFLTLTQSGSIVVEDLPLSLLVHENGSNEPGNYAQLIIDGGFSTNNSYVRFSKQAPADGKAIEITFIWVYRNAYCVQ